MKKLISLFLICSLLTGCANLKGGSVPEVSDEIESSSEITSEATSEPTSLVNVEDIIQDDWVTIDDAAEISPTKPVEEYDNKRVNYTANEAAEIINGIDNFTASKDLIVDLPSHVDRLSYYTERTRGYEDVPSIKEQARQFMDLYRFFAPDKEFHPEYFYINGVKQGGDGGVFVPFYMNYQDIIDGKVFDEEWSKEYYYDHMKINEIPDFAKSIYDDTVFLMNEKEPEDGYISLVCSYPYGDGSLYVFFGEINETLYDMGITDDPGYSESFVYDLECVDVCEPDSEESYQLLDKETTIKDAVKVYENYANSLPSLFEPAFNIKVKDVNVYKVNEELFIYRFNAVREYEGIKYDKMGEADNMANGEEFSSESVFGYMIRSDKIDIISGSYLRANEITEKTERTDIIPFDEAAQEIKDRLSAHVEFEVIEARLVYTSKSVKNEELNWYDYITTPCYKLVAHNLNDDRYYFCYLNACDKSDFRYYSASNYLSFF